MLVDVPVSVPPDGMLQKRCVVEGFGGMEMGTGGDLYPQLGPGRTQISNFPGPGIADLWGREDSEVWASRDEEGDEPRQGLAILGDSSKYDFVLVSQ